MSRRAVLMEKGGVFGAIGIAEVEGFEMVRAWDSRCGVKTGERAHCLVTAGFSDRIVRPEVEESEARGWRVFYDGPPLRG